MKQILLLSITFFYLKVEAQPILTAGIIPKVGQTVTYMLHDTTGVFQGSSGVNQTWTFNVVNTTPRSYTYVDPATTPYAAAFDPAVNIAYSDSAGFYTYAERTDNYYRYNGFKGPGKEMVFSVFEQTITAPFNYMNLVQSVFASSFLYGATSGQHNGEADQFYDGYGTLILNGVTYNNVVRVFLEENYDDITTSGTVTSHVETFYWYETTTMQRIFEMSTTYVNNAVTAKIVKSYSLITGIEEPSHLNPAPTISITTEGLVKITNPGLNALTIRVLDLTGKTIFTEEVRGISFEKSFSASVAGFAPGLYLVCLINADGKVTDTWKMMIR